MAFVYIGHQVIVVMRYLSEISPVKCFSSNVAGVDEIVHSNKSLNFIKGLILFSFEAKRCNKSGTKTMKIVI